MLQPRGADGKGPLASGVPLASRPARDLALATRAGLEASGTPEGQPWPRALIFVVCC